MRFIQLIGPQMDKKSLLVEKTKRLDYGESKKECSLLLIKITKNLSFGVFLSVFSISIMIPESRKNQKKKGVISRLYRKNS